MSHKFVLQGKSPLFQAFQHVLKMFAVPDNHITEGEHFAVKDGSAIHIGIMPLISSLRASTKDTALLDFLGAGADVSPLVNQWVSTASLLSSDAVLLLRGAGGASTPLSKHVFAEIERGIESCGLEKSFLAGTPRATVADFLLYAAIHSHPHGEAQVRSSTMHWSVFAQADAYLAPIVSKSAVVAAVSKAAKNSAAAPVYVKPSEEEIIRRRQEKEQAKMAKIMKGEAAAAEKPKTAKKEEPNNGNVTLDPTLLDVRVGRFTNVKAHPDADRLYVEEMDLGTEKRTIVSGLVGHYTPEELEGRLCLAVCNMKPRPLKGVASHGMVLCVSSGDKLCLVPLPEDAQPGDRIIFTNTLVDENLKVEPPKQLSSNVMAELINFLRTDQDGVVRWKDIPAHHARGIIKISEMPNGTVR